MIKVGDKVELYQGTKPKGVVRDIYQSQTSHNKMYAIQFGDMATTFHYETEFKVLPKENELLTKYLETYEGKKLTDKYFLTEVGTWCVKGEDPNCDLGGPHIQPILGYFQGKLIDVIKTAILLDGFWRWGEGGSLEKVEILNVKDTN